MTFMPLWLNVKSQCKSLLCSHMFIRFHSILHRFFFSSSSSFWLLLLGFTTANRLLPFQPIPNIFLCHTSPPAVHPWTSSVFFFFSSCLAALFLTSFVQFIHYSFHYSCHKSPLKLISTHSLLTAFFSSPLLCTVFLSMIKPRYLNFIPLLGRYSVGHIDNLYTISSLCLKKSNFCIFFCISVLV